MKKSKRFLSLLLAVAMVMGLMLSGVSATTVASDSNVVMSESFESWASAATEITSDYSARGATSWNGAEPATGWSINVNEGQVLVQPVLSGAQDGNVSIKLTPNQDFSVSTKNRAKLRYVMPAEVYAAMEDGAEYTLTIYFKGENETKANIEFKTYDEAYPSWPNPNVTIGSDWTKYEYKFVLDKAKNAEKNFATLELFAGIKWHADNTTIGNLYIDNVSIVKTKDAPKPEGGEGGGNEEEADPNVALFESFEDWTEIAAPHNVWKANGAPIVEVSSGKAQDGTKSIKFSTPNQDEHHRAKLNYEVPAAVLDAMEDGAEYTFTAYYYSDGAKYKGNWEVKHKASPWGSADVTLTDGQWVKAEYAFTLNKSELPSGKLILVMGMAWNSAANSVGDLYIDSVSLVKTKDAPKPEPEVNPNEIFAEDFENETEFPVKNDVADLAHEQYWDAGAGEIITSDAHAGSSSVKLTATAHTYTGWHLSDWAIGRMLIKAPIDNFEVGATYEISAWFKSSHASGVRSWFNVQVDPHSANTDFNPQMIENNTGTEWVQKKLEFTVPETETPYLVIRVGGGYYLPANTTEDTVADYYLLVDDIKIVKVGGASAPEGGEGGGNDEEPDAVIDGAKPLVESFEGWADANTVITNEYSVPGATSWNGAKPAEGWAISALNGSVLVQPVLGGAQDGNVSMKLTLGTDMTTMNRVKLQYRMPQAVYDKMEHGAEYTLTVYFKGTAKGNYEVKTYVPGLTSWPSKDVVISNEWAKTEYSFVLDKETPNPAPNVGTIDLFVGIPWHTTGGLTGELYIDNVSLIKTKDAPKDATGITIPENAFVEVGGETTLTAQLLPIGVTAKVDWTSSDETVATVDENGKVTGLKIGTAVITATSGSVSDTCNVVVHAKQEPTEDGFKFTEGFESATEFPVENIMTSLIHEAYWQGGAGAIITTNAHAGSNSVKLTASKHSYGTASWVSSDYAMGRVAFQIPIENLKEGAHYKVSAWFKSSHAEGVRAYFNVQSNPTSVLNAEAKHPNVGTEWVKKEIEFVMPAKDKLTGDMITFRIGCSDYMPKGTTEDNYGDYYLLVDDITVEQVPWVDKIVLSQKEAYLELGDTMDLTYELEPADQNVFVSFTSSDPSVVEVDVNGKLTAKKLGTAEITMLVSHGDAIAKCKVHVVEEYVNLESISIDKTTLDINPGWQGKLNITFNPSNAMENTVIWTSSDESVVKVDENGNLLALKTGTATITAKTPASGKTATCTVTVTDNADFASTSKDITVSIGQYETVDLSKILEGEYTVLTKSFKGKVEIDGDILKYTAYTWLMQDGNGFVDAEYTDTIKVAVQDGDKAAIITLNVTIGELEELFYDEDGEWITDVDLMFSQEYLDSIKADLKNNPNGERAKIFKYMLERVDKRVGAAILEYYDRKMPNAAVEYDTDLRPVADTTVNFLLAYLLTKDLPGYEAKNEVYLQETIRYAEAALAYPYWGATHYNEGYGWRNADLPAGHFLFSTAMVYHWLKDELKDETCTYRIGAKDNSISNPLLTEDLVTTTENMPMLEALEHRLWFVCEEMYHQTYRMDSYCGNHIHVRMCGMAAATIALRADAETQAEKDLLVKYTGLILFKDGLGMLSLMPDGTSQEGVPYWEYAAEFLIKAGVMIRDTLDIDLFETTRVFENSGDYVLYNLLPSDNWTAANSVLNVGDSPTGHWYGPDNIIRFIAGEYNKPNAQWLAQQIEDSGIGAGNSQWMNVMFFNDDVEPEAPTLDHTLHWFKDLDHVIARTDWSGNEDMLSVKCGIPFGKNLMQLQKDGVYTGNADAGHAHADANHITLYSNGEFLLRDDGYLRKAAGNHNTLLINGNGQLGEGGEYLREEYYFIEDAEPFMKLAESNSAYDYIVGNATEAYGKELNLDLFERNILWLKDEKVMLVVDNIKTSAISDLELRWFPQFKSIGPSGDVFIIKGNNNTMNFYPMTDETTTACEEMLVLGPTNSTAVSNEMGFRQTYKGTDWQNAVAFAWNENGKEVAFVSYQEGENADEHVFGVNGKIYTINVATNKITVAEGELEVEGDESASDSSLTTILVNGQLMEGFDPAVKEYTIDRWWKTAEVNVEAYTGAYGANLEIEYGKSVITLTCTSRDGTSKTTYTLNITNSQSILGIAGAETDRPRDGFNLGWTYDSFITPTNQGNIWANTGLPTVIYDLGKVVNLQDVIIAFNISARRDSYYDLLYSIDGENWISLQEDATVKQTDGALNSWHDPVKVVDDANVNARYVKVKLRAHSQNAKDDPAAYCSIQEITFIGSEYIAVNVTGGTIADGKDFYEVGDEITVTAEVPEGKKFVRWEVEGVDVDDLTAATITFTLGEDDVKLVAIFEDVIVDDGGDDGDDGDDDKDDGDDDKDDGKDDGASDTGDKALLLPALLLAVMALVACAVLTVGKKYRR